MKKKSTTDSISAKLPVMRSLPSDELLNRINQFREQLSESKTVTDREFRMMAKAIYGVKLIIADMLKGNDAKPLVISRQSLIDALGKICVDKYFFIGYCNGSHDFSLSEKSEEDLADEIIEAISDGL